MSVGIHTATSRVENSAQVLSCKMKFVHGLTITLHGQTQAVTMKSKLFISRCVQIRTVHLFLFAEKLPSLKLNTLPRLSPAGFCDVCSHICMFTVGVS